MVKKKRQTYWSKGKTYEELYGKEKAKELKEKIGQKSKGRKSWNKGLTKGIDERLKKSGEKQSKTKKIMFAKGELISSTKGKNIPKEIREKISNSVKKRYNEGILKPIIWTKKMKKNQSERMKKNNPMKNKDIAKKVGISNRKKKPKISETRKRLFKEGKLKIFSMLGKKHSEETRRNMSLAHIGSKMSDGLRKKHSIRMKKENPMKRPEILKKYKEWRKTQIIPIKDTSIEVKLQNFLKILGLNFYTHQYMKEITHAYQCDIFIPLHNLVIEADGDYWHGNPKFYRKEKLTKRQKKQKEKDNIRTKELLDKGFRVIRLWEDEIKEMKIEDFQKKLNKEIKNA